MRPVDEAGFLHYIFSRFSPLAKSG
jgi:hypothetical protein